MAARVRVEQPRCPKCSALLGNERPPYGARTCPSCAGALLSTTGTEHLLFHVAALPPSILEDAFPREQPLICLCGAPMKGLDVPAMPGREDERDDDARRWVWPGEVRLDVCTTCGRCFLEKGERLLLEPLG